MTQTFASTLLGLRKSDRLDWAVFSIGAASLFVAIVGTILTHGDEIAVNDEGPAAIILAS